MSEWDFVSSKLGSIESETVSIAKELFEVAKTNGHDIWFIWGNGTSAEHSTGLALDLMVRNKEAGDFVRNYIWEHRERLRLRHVIWWQAITSTVVSPGVVRAMGDRGNATKNHKDHIHVWFFAGSYRAPKVSEVNTPTEKEPTKKTSTGNSAVKEIQKLLKVEADGKWGPETDKRAILMRNAARAKSGWPTVDRDFDVRVAQKVVDTKVDGDWGPNSQEALEHWVEHFQELAGAKQDGLWGRKTDGKFISIRRRYLNKY